MIKEGSLHIFNHKNDICLQLNWQLIPIGFVHCIAHIHVAFGSQHTEVAVNKEIGKSSRNHYADSNDVEVDVL